MRLAKTVLFLASILWPAAGVAQDSAEIGRVADTMVRLCLAGGHTESRSGGGSGGADLSLRSLDIKGELKGEFKINKSSAEGLVNGIDNALSQVAADQADKVRACLQPVRERLLDVMLPPRPPPAPTIGGTWHDTNDPNNVTRITQSGDRFDFTRTGTLPYGVQYESSGSGRINGDNYTSEYYATYQNGNTSTGSCSGRLPRDGHLTGKCRDTVLGEFYSSATRE